MFVGSLGVRGLRALAPVRRADDGTDRRWGRCLAAVLAAGLLLRVGWYAADPCVWGDEAWTIWNVTEKGFAELAGPLRFDQAAPPAFLWAVKACHLLGGDGTHALRAVPFAAGCLALVALAFAGGGYPRAAVLPAVALFAGSSKMLGHCAEVKPYTLDALAAAAAAVWFVRTADRPLLARVGTACAISPLLVLLVYPGCLVAGGVLLGLAVAVARRRSAGAASLLALAGVLTAAALVAVLHGPGAAQQTARLRSYWVDLGQFPDWSRPWSVPGWLAVGTGGLFRYALYPLGLGFVPVAAVGAWRLIRTGRADVAVMLLAPVGLAAAAGLAGKYPFGGSRLHLYAAPGLALACGVGLLDLWERAATLRAARFVPLVRGLLAVAACWGVAEGVVTPAIDSTRVEYRPAAAAVLALPAAERVVVSDHTFLYYLRGRPGVRYIDDLDDVGRGAVWLGSFTDPRIDPVVDGVLRAGGWRVTDTRAFGRVLLRRIER